MRRSISPSRSLPAATAAPTQGRRGFFADLVGDLSRGQPVLRVQSGLPQPADALMATMILILATGYGLRVPIHYDLYLAGLAFLSWVRSLICSGGHNIKMLSFFYPVFTMSTISPFWFSFLVCFSGSVTICSSRRASP